MYSAIAARNQERTEKLTQLVVRQFPNLTDLTTPTVIGSFAWTSQTIQTKWYQQFHARNFGGGWTTPGDLARDYLAIKFPKRKARCTSRQWRECVQTQVDPPLFCIPERLKSACYLDLSAAYWQIVRAAGWDVDYCPEAWLGTGSEMIDWPYPSEKMARNCLVSVGQGDGTMSLWDGQKMIYTRKPNRFINKVLWRLVCDVLNGIALDMIQKAHAVYVYVDGYIIDQRYLGEAVEVAASWGVDFKIKHAGAADVRAPAAYGFDHPTEGHFATMPYRTFFQSYGLEKVYEPGRKFLRERFRRLAEQAKTDWLFLERG